jgi:hypothetical protein
VAASLLNRPAADWTRSRKSYYWRGVRGVCLSNCRESANANVSLNKTMIFFLPVHSCLRAKCWVVLVFWLMTAHVNTPPPKSQNYVPCRKLPAALATVDAHQRLKLH